MKKGIALMIVGMFVLVGCGSIVFAEPDDPTDNAPPNAPVLIAEKSDWTEETYGYAFYAVDPDGDDVYYDINWKKVDEPFHKVYDV